MLHEWIYFSDFDENLTLIRYLKKLQNFFMDFDWRKAFQIDFCSYSILQKEGVF